MHKTYPLFTTNFTASFPVYKVKRIQGCRTPELSHPPKLFIRKHPQEKKKMKNKNLSENENYVRRSFKRALGVTSLNRKFKVALMLGFIAVIFTLFISRLVEPTLAASWGTNLGIFNNTTVYSNGSTGTVCSGSNCRSMFNGQDVGLKWQCVEFVNRYYLTNYGINPRNLAGGAHANGFWAESYAARLGMTRYANGGTVAPQTGDMILSLGGTFGHIAIVRSISGNQVRVAQQNWYQNSTDVDHTLSLSISNGRYTVGPFGSSSSYPIVGWMRRVGTTTPPACTSGSSASYTINGYAPVHPNGALIKLSSDQTYYLLREGQKRGITSPSVLEYLYQNGGFRFEDVITVSQTEFDSYSTGDPLTDTLPTNGKAYPDGTIVRKPTGEIALVSSNGGRRPFTSYALFQNMGYKDCNIVNVTESEYSSFPQLANADAMPKLIASLRLYNIGSVGQQIQGKFTIKNVGNSSFTFSKLGIGGRLNGSTITDFPLRSNLTLNPGQEYAYDDLFTPQAAGTYRFFVTYQETNNVWTTSVPRHNNAINTETIVITSNTPTNTPTHTPTFQASSTSTRTSTNTPTATSTNTPNISPTPTSTLTATATPTGSPIAVSMPDVSWATGSVVTVPITVGNMTGRGIVSYECQVSFNPSVVQPASPAIDQIGTLSSTTSISANPVFPGHLIISAFQGGPFNGAGTLLNLRFNVVGSSGQSTALTFSDYTDPNGQFHHGFMFNEGTPPAATTNGSITVGAATLSGTVTYGNVSGAPNPRGVPNVNVCAQGSPTVCTITGTDGTYVLSGLGSGQYTVTASKSGGANGISAFDASRISQYVAGMIALSPNQMLAADVSENSSVSSFDSAQIGMYVAGSPAGSTGAWKFTPQNVHLSSVSGNPVQDFSALLLGDVSGNWSNSGSRISDLSGMEQSETVVAPSLVTPADSEVIIPISVNGALNKAIASYEFDLSYDPDVILPQAEPVNLDETLSKGLTVVANAVEPGLLRVAAYGAFPIKGNGVLLNLRFTAVGKSGTVSPLVWERVMFNEDEAGTLATNGVIELSDAATNQAEMTGRVVNPTGQGIPNARVTLTDSAGAIRSITSNSFGSYYFGVLTVGQTYTISVTSNGYSFTTLTVSITDKFLTQDMVAEL